MSGVVPFSGYNLQRSIPGDYHIGDAGFDSLFGCCLISPLKHPYFFSFVAYAGILIFQMYLVSPQTGYLATTSHSCLNQFLIK